MRAKLCWASFAALTLVAVLALSGCRSGDAVEDTGPQTVAVERRNLRITAEATGQVEPITSIEVKSKASGEVLRIHVETGDQVAAGALLAEIDPRDVRNAYDQAEADLDVAQARVEISQANLERSRELFQSQVITRQEFENARLDEANARAALVKAQTNLQLAEQRLGDVTIRAPIAGTIIQKSVEEGGVIQSASQNISGGTTLFIMADLALMQVRTLIDETDMGRIAAEQPATVSVEAFPGRNFTGAVEKIEPQAVVQQNVTMFPVIVRLDNREGMLKPGMNAEVEILIAERQAVLTVPNGAVIYPQDVAPAAMALGLDPEKIQMDRTALARDAQAGAATERADAPAAEGAGAGSAPAEGAASARPFGGRGGGPDSVAGGPQGGQGGQRGAVVDSLRRLVRSGQLPPDSLRALMQRARASGAGPVGAGGAGGAGTGQGGGGGFGGGFAGQRAQGAGDGAPAETKPAVLFVLTQAGVLEPRPIVIGLNDWDYTEIVRGVEEGEQIALIGAAQLQARQQEFLEQMRNRRGLFPGQGGFIGRGGDGGGGGRGR